MQVESLTIALVYAHRYAGTWSLLDLREHRGVIAPEDLEPAAFLNACGAMRMYDHRFKCFLNTSAAGDLRSYVNFLIESLVSQGDASDARMFADVSIGDPFFDFKDVVAGLFQENQTTIILQDSGDGLRLSYLNSQREAPESRLSPYFCDLKITRKMWRMAAMEALEEYFCVTEELLQNGRNDDLERFVSSWRSYRNIFVP